MIWLPLGIISLLGVGLYKRHQDKDYGVMTPNRQMMFQSAVNNLRDPDQLRKFADGYDKLGLKEAAKELRNRAKLRALTPAQKAARKAALKKGLALTDPAKVEQLADAFHKEGYTANAGRLREYASALRKANDIPAIIPLPSDGPHNDVPNAPGEHEVHEEPAVEHHDTMPTPAAPEPAPAPVQADKPSSEVAA